MIDDVLRIILEKMKPQTLILLIIALGCGLVALVLTNQMLKDKSSERPSRIGSDEDHSASDSLVYVAFSGQQAGPFDLATIGQKIKAGEISRETLVWKQGMITWQPAGQTPETAGFFSVPPPIPRP